jgi:hypothetical protein
MMVFSSLASKLVAMVCPGLGLKISNYEFGDLCLKITATVSSFRPQNQAAFGLSVASQNRQREVSVGHASKSSGLLGV